MTITVIAYEIRVPKSAPFIHRFHIQVALCKAMWGWQMYAMSHKVELPKRKSKTTSRVDGDYQVISIQTQYDATWEKLQESPDIEVFSAKLSERLESRLKAFGSSIDVKTFELDSHDIA